MKKHIVIAVAIFVSVAFVSSVFIYIAKLSIKSKPSNSNICQRKNEWRLQQYPAEFGGGGGKGPIAYDSSFETAKCSKDNGTFAPAPLPAN